MIETDTYRRVVSAKMFIDKNYSEPISLEQISQKAFFSKFHFHRLFTRIYQITPHDYLTSKRLHHAKQLLQQEGLNIQDVCNSVGFESLASFSLLFKKRNGFAPQYYRNLAYLKKKLAKEQPKRFIPHCMLQQMGIEDSKNQ
jgi:AraC-like DNA-binding protein